MHRNEYICAPAPEGTYNQVRAARTALHRDYYGQYVTPEITHVVINHVGLKALQESENEHFNDIPLRTWDRISYHVSNMVGQEMLKANGEHVSLSLGVCIAKEAARRAVRG